jgi:Mrp family chromosome partitioning ATPase
MTALDQALIKAFTQKGFPAATAALRPTTHSAEQPLVPLDLDSSEAATLATLDSVLAALERPPRGSSILLEAESRADSARPVAVEEASPEPWAVSVEQWVIGDGQWAARPEQWATPIGQWTADSQPHGSSHEAQAVGLVDTTDFDETPLHPAGGMPIPVPRPCEKPDAEPAAFPAGATDEEAEQPTILSLGETALPAQRVDHFTWPKVCRRLIARAAVELDRLADALAAASASGQKVLAIAGYRPGEGATTLLLCAARRLSERGIKTALVDADLARPRLARRLGAQPRLGWDETTAEEESAWAQALGEATANNLALLPVREPSSPGGGPVRNPSRLGGSVKTLRNRYDLVLVDLGPLEDAGLAAGTPTWAMPGTIDAIVLTHDERITSEAQLLEVHERLAALGIAVVGIVENFVAEG